MTPNEYQRAAMRTAPQKLSLAEAALGMATEASEAADVLKKHLYQGHPLNMEKLKKEMGDALWYMAYVCHMTDGLDLEGVMRDNIKKLSVRFTDGFTPEASIARADENQNTKNKKDEIIERLRRASEFFIETYMAGGFLDREEGVIKRYESIIYQILDERRPLIYLQDMLKDIIELIKRGADPQKHAFAAMNKGRSAMAIPPLTAEQMKGFVPAYSEEKETPKNNDNIPAKEPTIIRCRLQRGGLKESMETLTEHADINDMVKYLFENAIPQLNPMCTVIGIAPYVNTPDERIGWRRTNIITMAVYDAYFNRIYKNEAFAFCDAKVMEREWYWYHKNTGEIKKIRPDDYPGMALGG